MLDLKIFDGSSFVLPTESTSDGIPQQYLGLLLDREDFPSGNMQPLEIEFRMLSIHATMEQDLGFTPTLLSVSDKGMEIQLEDVLLVEIN